MAISQSHLILTGSCTSSERITEPEEEGCQVAAVAGEEKNNIKECEEEEQQLLFGSGNDVLIEVYTHRRRRRRRTRTADTHATNG